MRSYNPFGTCRNCGCQIMWVKTKAGKNMPVDPTMISYRRPGAGVKAKEKIVTPEGEVVCADKVSSESAEGLRKLCCRDAETTISDIARDTEAM